MTQHTLYSQAAMREGTRLFSSFSFWLDKGMLRCGNNFWSDFLCLIVHVVKAFQHQETQFSPHRNMHQEQKSLTICWTAWIVLPWVQYYPWSCSLFPASQSMAYTLPLPRWAYVDSQKMGSRLIWRRRTLPKPSMGTHGQGWVANCTQYIFSPEMSHDCACTGHEAFHRVKVQ